MEERSHDTVRSGGAASVGLRLVERTADLVGLTLFIGVMVVTLLQVLARYAHVAIPWTEELARVMFIAAMMLGIAVAMRRGEHVVVDFLFAPMPPRAKAGLLVVFDLLSLGLLTLWLRGALALAELNGDATYVTLPWLSVAATYIVEAIAIALMMLFFLADLMVQARTIAGTRP